MDANHKFDTRVTFTFLGNEKKLICAVLTEKDKNCSKNKTTSNENENTKTIRASRSKVKIQLFEENIKERKK